MLESFWIERFLNLTKIIFVSEVLEKKKEIKNNTFKQLKREATIFMRGNNRALIALNL